MNNDSSARLRITKFFAGFVLLLFAGGMNTANAMSYPPDGYRLEAKQESPKHSFFVEIYSQDIEGEGARCVWLVPIDKAYAPQLLVTPGDISDLYDVRVSVSPDERWILRDQKLYHGANAIALYERNSDFHFKEIGPPIFSEQAWHFFAKQTHRRFDLDYRFIVRVSDWPAGNRSVSGDDIYEMDKKTTVSTPNNSSILVSLVGESDGITVVFWCCLYDLQKHRFYLDDELEKHNRDTGSVEKK